jgi:hypothetical protein
LMLVPRDDQSQNDRSTSAISTLYEKHELERPESSYTPHPPLVVASSGEDEEKRTFSKRIAHQIAIQQERGRPTLVLLVADAYRWSKETFPTVMTVLAHLPFALVPFAFSMFVLVQALVTRGWVPVFAYGWDHWATKTGTIGSIGGMGFVSVVLCNVSLLRVYGRDNSGWSTNLLHL